MKRVNPEMGMERHEIEGSDRVRLVLTPTGGETFAYIDVSIDPQDPESLIVRGTAPIEILPHVSNEIRVRLRSEDD